MPRSSKPRNAAAGLCRKPLTKEMLLPLSSARVRALSLEHHLAFVAMRNGGGDVNQMVCLLKVVYLTYFLLDAVRDDNYLDGEIDALRRAEAALDRCSTRAESGQSWMIPAEDHAILERILALHDGQLSSVVAHRYTAACNRVHVFATSKRASPIPVERIDQPGN